VRYFSSQAIHCDKCNTRQLKNGVTEYFHQAVTPTLVCPGESLVLPLEPALVMPQDGHEKQDCENAAAKRWLRAHGVEWAARGATLLGDDLYGHQPATLNILGYVWHTVLELVDADYRAVRVLLGPRATFFGDVRTLLKYMYWGSWEELMGFMRKELESGRRRGRAAPR
jgi:hypothetical protein